MASNSTWSVRTLLLLLVLACLLPGVIGAALLFIHQYREGRVQQERDTIQTARALVQAVDSHLLRVQIMGEMLATESSLVDGDFATFREHARQVIRSTKLAANVVVREKNHQLALNALIPPGDPLPRQPIREHVQRVFDTGRPSISTLYGVAQFEHPIISVDVPVFIREKVEYSLGISVFPQHLNTIVQAQKLPPGWVAAVLDSSGTVVGRNITPERFVGNKATSLLIKALARSPEGSIQATSQEGTPVQTSYSRSPMSNWTVAIGIPRQSLQDAMIVSLARLAAGIATLFGIGLVLAWYMGNRIARSVRALTIPALALGRGEIVEPPRVDLKEAGEVGAALVQAAELLDQRAAALRVKENELAQAHTRLREVIDNSPALIYLKDINGHFLLANKTYERLIQVKPSVLTIGDQNVSKSSSDTGPSDADLRVIRSGGITQFEEEVHTTEGLKHFAVSKAPLRDSDGQVVGICAVAVDITSLKNAEAHILELVSTLERRVDLRTEELNAANSKLLGVNEQLKEANSQLEAFSYTVAHDLRAPLRGIQGFSDALAEDYQSILDDTGKDYLQRIAKAADRMERLIDDLLSLSRMTRMELPLGAVSLIEIFLQVNLHLDAQIQGSRANIHIAPNLPWVRGNKTACLQVFQNLVSNALKFSRPNVPLSIRIWAESPADEHNATRYVRIWVEDNGIGIPQAQQQRIFRPFERLHGMSEYPGSGIGLAIVDKAVRRMHGRCGVDSGTEAGSRFWVELPVLEKGE